MENTEVKDTNKVKSEVVASVNTASASNNDVEDQELNDLLNEAVEDFNKPSVAVSGEKSGENSSEQEPSNSEESKEWLNDFVQKVSGELGGELKDYLEQMNDGRDISDLLVGDNFLKFVENSSQLLENGNPDNTSEAEQLKETISETMRSLSEGIENLQSSLPDELNGMFSGLSMSDDSSLEPFMNNIMEMFLSKEVLYPSMDAICQNFPKWLTEREPVLSKEEFEKYKQQYELMSTIVRELEKEKPEDSAAVKKERFKTIMELMNKLQKYGHPPKELVSDFDLSGVQQLPMDLDPSKCSMM